MASWLDTVDPEWAWRPFTPNAENAWDFGKVMHLYRRVAFGAAEQDARRAVEKSPSDIVDSLLKSSPDSSEFAVESKSIADALIGTGDVQQLSAWWLHRLRFTPDPMVEKLVLLWHGHFATSGDKVVQIRLMLAQNETLRKYALGDYAALVHAIAKDPAMLIYLDSAYNRKAHPNENFARELMELFCLGEGNYTESDVQQLARCFTGWEIRRDQYRFNRYQADTASKKLLGFEGELSGEEAIDLVLSQPSCENFVARKLIHWFLLDEPQLPEALIRPVGKVLRQSNWSIREAVRVIVSSQIFNDSRVRGRKVRSPVDLVIELMRTLKITANFKKLAHDLSQVGQALFFPPNVKGWDGGRAWINSSTLLGRSNMIRHLIFDGDTKFDGGSLAEFVARNKLENVSEFVDWMSSVMLAVPLRSQTREVLLEQVRSMPKARQHAETLYLFCTLPEIHLA